MPYKGKYGKVPGGKKGKKKLAPIGKAGKTLKTKIMRDVVGGGYGAASGSY